MPNEKDAKLEQEQDDPQQNRGSQQQSQQQSQGGGTAQGGEIKDKEAETSDSYGHTRDSGERPK
jgi:hypothetical protein